MYSCFVVKAQGCLHHKEGLEGCFMYKTVVGCCEGRPNQFLKTGVREEALSIIINLSAALICLFLSLSPIHYLHFRSTIPFLFCVVFVHLSFSPPLLHSSPPLLVFWLISPCPVFQCFSMWILLFTNKPDKPEWKADTHTHTWEASAPLLFSFTRSHTWRGACMHGWSWCSKRWSQSYLWPICILRGPSGRLLDPPAYPSHLTDEEQTNGLISYLLGD